MRKFLIKAAFGAAALLSFGAANADVIDFENLDTTYAPYASFGLMADGDVLLQGQYFINTQDLNGSGGGGPFSGALVGQLSTGTDASSCLNGVCPAGNSTTFLSAYNDSLVHVGQVDGVPLIFGGVDAAYISTPGVPAGSTVLFAVEADRDDGTYAVFYYQLGSNGAFQSISASGGTFLGGVGTLTSGNVTDLYFYSYFCDGSTGSCGSFRTDKGQFAIDNISVTAVPEPAEWMLMLAGITAVGAVVRRRRAA